MAHSSLPSVPPLECLVAALTAARCGSFTAAAEELNVSHGAISRRVAAAEAWAAVTLFERHGRGVRLTPDGQRILGRIEHAFSVIDDAADSWRKPRRRSVRIATTASFAQIWLLPRLERIEKELGQTRVEVLAAQQNANLATFEADIAIRYGRGGWNTEYEEKLFAQEALVPVVSRKLSQQTGRKPTAEKIASMPLLHDSDSTCWRAWFSSHRLQFRNKPADRVLGDYMLTLAAAAEGLGVALLNKPLGAPGLLESQLVELGLESAPAPLSYHVLARASGADSAVVQCLRILRDRVS